MVRRFDVYGASCIDHFLEPSTGSKRKASSDGSGYQFGNFGTEHSDSVAGPSKRHQQEHVAHDWSSEVSAGIERHWADLGIDGLDEVDDGDDFYVKDEELTNSEEEIRPDTNKENSPPGMVLRGGRGKGKARQL